MNFESNLVALATALAALATPSLAGAQDASASAQAPVYERGGMLGTGLVAGLKGAVGFGQVYDTTGLGLLGELELGWVTPYDPVQVFLTGSYVSTSREESVGADARLPGDLSYDLAQQQFVLTLGALYRVPLSSELVRPYVGLGGRLYMTSTEIDGFGGGEPFGTYTEQGTDWGFYGCLGADVFVGPGSILVELQTGYAPVDRFVLQETSTGMLNVALGYRLFL
jgi:hypothetical protein